MNTQPLCFVLMPFGKKTDAAGKVIDFDAVYEQIIRPAVTEAALMPLRADEEISGGIIHKPMFERLVLCEYAVADLTAANANVFYELGVRHATRQWSTVCLFAEGGRLPFDVVMLRALPYKLSDDGLPMQAEADRAALSAFLHEAKNAVRDGAATDSPLYQLLQGYPRVTYTSTEAFREQVRCADEWRVRLRQARAQGKAGKEAMRAVEAELGNFEEAETGVVFDLLFTYRAAEAWPEMIELVGKAPRPLAETRLMQEQLAFALNRVGRVDDAERVLLKVLQQYGPHSETLGLFGRLYKDRWEAAVKQGRALLARGLIEKAIAAYRRGFEADWRDPYPGINAVTLMTLKDPPDPQRERLIPVVAYTVEQRIAAASRPDYWDCATLLELAVLAKDEERAAEALGNALAALYEGWMLETTARHLRLIREAREKRGTVEPWMTELESEMARQVAQLAGTAAQPAAQQG